MSIRHSAAAIAVATAMFGPAVGIAAAGNGGTSRATVSVCEDTQAHRNDAVREGEAVVTELGVNASAITYWVSESDGWHVVTTVDIRLAQDQDDDTRKQSVVRFSAVLLPGQLQRISVPVAIGERQQVLCIRRFGDRLEVARVFGPSV